MLGRSPGSSRLAEQPPAERCCSREGCSASRSPVDEHGVRRLLARPLRIGLGLTVPSLTRRAVQPDDGLVDDGTITIGARHAGLVVALALVAPLLSNSLQNGARDALLGATRVALDGNAPIRQKCRSRST